MSPRLVASLRVLLAATGFIGAVTGPTWLPVLAVVLLALRFRAWEGILIGLTVDLLWQPSGWIIGSFPLYTFGAIVLIWALEPLRKKLITFV